MNDYSMLREEVISFSQCSDYKKVRIIGGTGAGKSQFMRHLLDTEKNNFPAVATGKCTVSKIEVITNSDDLYSGVITLYTPMYISSKIDELVDNMIRVIPRYIECKEEEIIDKLYAEFRKISNQTFKLNFLLGLQDVKELLVEFIETINKSITEHQYDCKEDIDEEVYDILCADTKNIRTKLFNNVILKVKKLIENWHRTTENSGVTCRLDYLEEYKDYYPARICILNVINKDHFLSLLQLFIDNSVKKSGHILNTIIEGIRVVGNFRPNWYKGSKYNFIFIDGIGLGHNPEYDKNVEREVEKCDNIIYLKDIKAELSAIEEGIIETFIRNGWTDKMIFAFTHFDDTLSNPEIVPTDFKERKNFIINNFIEAIKNLKNEQIKNETDHCNNDDELLQLSINSIEKRYSLFAEKVQNDSFAFCLKTNKIDVNQVKNVDDSYDLMMELNYLLKESNIFIDEYLNNRNIDGLIHKIDFKYSEKLFIAAIVWGMNEFNKKWENYKNLDGRITWRTIKALCNKYANDINYYCSYDVAAILSDSILEKINAVIDGPKTDADIEQIALVTEQISLEISKKLYPFICEKIYFSVENKINWEDADELRQYTNGSKVTYRKSVIDRNNSMGTRSLCDIAIRKKRDINYEELRIKNEFLEESLRLIKQALKIIMILHNDMLNIELVQD